MTVAYYVETNLICIVLLILLKAQLRQRHEDNSTKRIVFGRLLWAAVALCAADMVAGCCRGRTFPGAWIVIEASNLLFFEMTVLLCYLWTMYVEISLDSPTNSNRSKAWLLALPLIVFSVLAASNPLTGFIFDITDDNLYVRGFGVYVHWIVVGLYMLISTARAFAAMLRARNKARRQELLPLLTFMIAPTVASLFQVFFYGVTCLQVGFTLSVMFVFLIEQSNQIAADALTGLNNRRGLEKFLFNCVQNRTGESVTALMIDVDNFKQINDRYGHLTGDRALIDMATVLKAACDNAAKKTFLCRFGGDEFLIVGRDMDEADSARLMESIHSALEKVNSSGANAYTLIASIGTSCLVCSDMKIASQLIRAADESMYADKKATQMAGRP